MSVLEIRSLTTSLLRQGRWTPVVQDVSLDVDARETVAIVGESGSGKSVTMLSVMRLLPERLARISGSVLLNGRDLLSLTESEMETVRGREAAVIFQEPMTSLNPVLTVGRQISETMMRHRGIGEAEAEAEAIRLLERVRIPAARARFMEHPFQLSGGTLQRVMIAIALSCRPKLLIADEPTTALDVTVQAQILQLIKELQEEDGMAVLFITHDMGVVAEIADRVVVMRQSRIVETGEAAAIFARPAHDYTRTLLAAVPKLGAAAGPVSVVTEPAPPVLDVSNLVTRFDIKGGFFGRIRARVHAVENVSFELAAGETLALVGESGCGKSTVGRSILRLVEPLSGSIRVDGQDMLALSGSDLVHQRRRMQMIFQDPASSLNPRMRIGEALTEALLAHGIAHPSETRDRAAALLERVGLGPDMASRFPHEFSGGQKQRICIARALALGPRLIVADEAVSALDASIKAQITELMQELQSSLGIAYLFISHDMAVVEKISHRVAVMHQGEIVEIGPGAAVFGSPRHPYTQKLLAAVPIADPAQRHRRRSHDDREPPSPLRPPDFRPRARHFVEIGPGHFVQDAAAYA